MTAHLAGMVVTLWQRDAAEPMWWAGIDGGAWPFGTLPRVGDEIMVNAGEAVVTVERVRWTLPRENSPVGEPMRVDILVGLAVPVEAGAHA